MRTQYIFLRKALDIQPNFIDAKKARELAREKQLQREISRLIEDAEEYSNKQDYENAIGPLDKVYIS